MARDRAKIKARPWNRLQIEFVVMEKREWGLEEKIQCKWIRSQAKKQKGKEWDWWVGKKAN